MNVLSLFDGMSCGQIALKSLGVKPLRYYASEIDTDAVKVTQENHPDTIQLGDVLNWRNWDIEWSTIDLVIGGSPCQGFSYMGDQLAFDDPRSVLFFTYVEILNHIREMNPSVKFLLENVKMKRQWIDVISLYLCVEPVFINSEILAPYDRPRYYWSNMKIKQPQRVDKSFRDVVGDDFLFMSSGWHKWWDTKREFQLKKSYSKVCDGNDKGVCMTARQYASWNGNFIEPLPGLYAKPDKKALARLVGADENYFNSVTQRKAEEMTGNGWTIPVISHILLGVL